MKNNKKHLIFWTLSVFLISIFLLNISYSGSECEYLAKIDKCSEANKPSSSIYPRSITDFICIKWSLDERIYQIVLDEKFKELDKDINKYLTDLETNKSFYFWKDAQKSYIEWVDEIERNFAIHWKYWKKYKKLCWTEWILQDVITCSDDKSTPNILSKGYLDNGDKDNPWVCMNLAITQLYIAKAVAFNILHLNKQQVKDDEHKIYVKQERKKYDELIDSMNINTSYLDRILKKWPSKTLKPH